MKLRMRPVLRWHGGKWRLAPWIISHFPPHRVYVEPFGGAGSVIIRKTRSYAEVYNDLDCEAVNLFRVLQDPQQASLLISLLKNTPFAREEFKLAYCAAAGATERARRLIIRSFMGFGSDGHNNARMTSFRANSNRSGTTPAHDWANYPECLGFIVERLRGVVIENRPAMEVMAAHDGPETLHYLDPPYVHSTRESNKRYTHEMSNAEHEKMLECALGLRGMVIISGYSSPLYDSALAAWNRETTDALADGAKKRLECLWMNPALVDRYEQHCMIFKAAS